MIFEMRLVVTLTKRIFQILNKMMCRRSANSMSYQYLRLYGWVKDSLKCKTNQKVAEYKKHLDMVSNFSSQLNFKK